MRQYFKVLYIVLAAITGINFLSFGQESPEQVVFKNVKVFDGESDELTGITEVLVEGNKIKEISTSLASFTIQMWVKVMSPNKSCACGTEAKLIGPGSDFFI